MLLLIGLLLADDMRVPLQAGRAWAGKHTIFSFVFVVLFAVFVAFSAVFAAVCSRACLLLYLPYLCTGELASFEQCQSSIFDTASLLLVCDKLQNNNDSNNKNTSDRN